MLPPPKGEAAGPRWNISMPGVTGRPQAGAKGMKARAFRSAPAPSGPFAARGDDLTSPLPVRPGLHRDLHGLLHERPSGHRIGSHDIFKLELLNFRSGGLFEVVQNGGDLLFGLSHCGGFVDGHGGWGWMRQETMRSSLHSASHIVRNGASSCHPLACTDSRYFCILHNIHRIKCRQHPFSGPGVRRYRRKDRRCACSSGTDSRASH